MKINNSEKIRLEWIDNLPIGQIIVYNNSCYIITNNSCIVNLSDGSTVRYDSSDKAIPIEAELTIL